MGRAGFELRVELGGKVERVVPELQAFHPVFIGRREDKTGFFKVFYISGIYFVAVTVPFNNLFLFIQAHGKGIFLDIHRIVSQPHSSAKFMESFLLRKEGNYVRSLPEFFARGIDDTEFMAGIFDNSELEPQAEPQERDVIFTRKFYCFQFALNAPLAKPPGN